MTKSHTSSDSTKPVSIGFFSMGCAKNLVDSQIMATELIREEIILARTPEEADVVVVNTCAFIEEAREESIDAIMAACELKKSGPCRAVVVTGCMPQRYRDTLKDELPEVDAFMGLDELEQIVQVVRQVAGGKRGIMNISAQSERVFEPKQDGVVFSGGPYAYVKIAEGCNHRCAFCAIPGIRGRYRSRSLDSIVKEAEHLLGRGFRELNLISQDVTSYGKDLDGDVDTTALLRALGGIGGEFWIRLLYGYPSYMTDALLETMRDTPQVCHYLDLPIQHSSEAVLRRMRRVETHRHVISLASRARQAMPAIVLRTTCLVGFPGETEEEFQELLDFVRETEFDHLGVFTYSPEEDTEAFSMADRPDADQAEERRQRLLDVQRDVVDRKCQGLVGGEDTILIERMGEDNVVLGRSYRLAPEVDGEVFVAEAREEDIGKFVKVTYTAQSGYDMEARRL